MPRIKKATDANGNVFYPISISKAIWDTDSNQRLSTTIGNKANKSATVSTVTYDTTNKKIKKTINGSTTDVVTAAKIVEDGGGVINTVESAPTDNSTKLVISGGIRLADNGVLALSMLIPKISDSTYSTVTMIDNPEFYSVIVDTDDKIIAGVRKDGSYVGLPYMEAVEAIVGIIDDIDNPV